MADKNMEQVMEKAQVLIEALPYIQRFNRKIIVVKYGGSAMVDEQLKKQVIQDVTLLKLVGFKPIIVHGGGKEISKWVGKVGMEPVFVNGLRKTDADTMEIAEMVLNKVNKSLVTLVEELGVQAVGVSGKDGGLQSVLMTNTIHTISMQMMQHVLSQELYQPKSLHSSQISRVYTRTLQIRIHLFQSLQSQMSRTAYCLRYSQTEESEQLFLEIRRRNLTMSNNMDKQSYIDEAEKELLHTYNRFSLVLAPQGGIKGTG